MYECHYLDNIILPPIESYQASVPVQQVSATDKPKLMSCTIVTSKTIGAHHLLKVLFDSGSTKIMIHCSALPTRFQCISNLSLFQFQNLVRFFNIKKPANYLILPSLSSIATYLLIHRLLVCWTKSAHAILSLVSISLTNSDSPTIIAKYFTTDGSQDISQESR